MAADWQAHAGKDAMEGMDSPERGPVMGYLDVTEPGRHAPRVVPLQDALLIGRAPAAGMPPHETAFIGIAEHTVSRRHARIERRGATYVVEDLNSVNGTFVGDERLVPGRAQVLCDGDAVGIGATVLVFHSLVAAGQGAEAGVAAVSTAASHVESRIVGSIDATRYASLPGEGIGAGVFFDGRNGNNGGGKNSDNHVNDTGAKGGAKAAAHAAAGPHLPAMPQAVSPATFQATVRKLHAMAQVGIALGVVRDRPTLIEKLMKFMFDLFPLADRAFMLLCEPPGTAAAPVPVAARRRDGGPLDPASIRLSRTILQMVLTGRRALLCADSLADLHLGRQDSILAQPMRSIMCVPLLLEDECLGMLQVDTSRDPHAFNEDDLEMMTGVCAQAAVTLKTFLLYADIEHLFDGFVSASVQAIEERDPVTAGHSARVADYAVRLARSVDASHAGALRSVRFSRAQVREIRYAALLHDFGKVGVREHVLCKEKKLHPDALRLLQERFHTARAANRARAYQRLVEAHLAGGIDGAALRAEKDRVDRALASEDRHLDRFLAMILQANEPQVGLLRPGQGNLHGVHAAASTSGPSASPLAAAMAELAVLSEYRFPDHHSHQDEQRDDAAGIAIDHTNRADAGADADQAHARCGRRLLEPFELSALSLERGCLTHDERRQIESHVSDTHAFLILIPWTRELAGVPAIAHAHHEKLDGSGYPRGLRGAEIGMQSRILTICDIFDALTAADRPYKKAVPLDAALALMQEECDCGHLDSTLFDVFVQTRAWSPA